MKLEYFLAKYCARLSGSQTTSVRRLAGLVDACPRLAPPLFLYALTTGRLPYLLASETCAWACEEWWALAVRAEEVGEERFFNDRDQLPRDYAKVLEVWEADCGKLDRARRRLGPICERTRTLLEEKGLTAGRVCREMGLNRGNVYAYLRGDVTKLSDRTARMLYRFVRDYER